jgi:BirA family biotin operon repressor/biotin-[acetyl-CoA-carboxylase] ligase
VTAPDHGRAGAGEGGEAFAPPAAWQHLALSDDEVAPEGGWSVWYVAETGSTNADLLELHGAPDRTVLVAGHQSAGRGRLDRRWEAPPEANLLVSILLRDVPDPPGDVTRRVGVATADAVRAVAGANARLKWPNDLVLEGRKLAGILAQRMPTGPIVVGLGLNVGWAPEGAARLRPGVRPVAVLTELLRRLDMLPAPIDDRYRALLDTLGRRVRVELPGEELTGTAVDVEPDGRLVVVDACAITHRIDAGDVVHLRDAPAE